jgi:hypothetical protein
MYGQNFEDIKCYRSRRSIQIISQGLSVNAVPYSISRYSEILPTGLGKTDEEGRLRITPKKKDLNRASEYVRQLQDKYSVLWLEMTEDFTYGVPLPMILSAKNSTIQLPEIEKKHINVDIKDRSRTIREGAKLLFWRSNEKERIFSQAEIQEDGKVCVLLPLSDKFHVVCISFEEGSTISVAYCPNFTSSDEHIDFTQSYILNHSIPNLNEPLQLRPVRVNEHGQFLMPKELFVSSWNGKQNALAFCLAYNRFIQKHNQRQEIHDSKKEETQFQLLFFRHDILTLAFRAEGLAQFTWQPMKP